MLVLIQKDVNKAKDYWIWKWLTPSRVRSAVVRAAKTEELEEIQKYL
jgi:hypothetical protein